MLEVAVNNSKNFVDVWVFKDFTATKNDVVNVILFFEKINHFIKSCQRHVLSVRLALTHTMRAAH